MLHKLFAAVFETEWQEYQYNNRPEVASVHGFGFDGEPFWSAEARCELNGERSMPFLDRLSPQLVLSWSN